MQRKRRSACLERSRIGQLEPLETRKVLAGGLELVKDINTVPSTYTPDVQNIVAVGSISLRVPKRVRLRF